MKDLLETILDIQETNPQLILCGSAALIYSKLLPSRKINDIDFVCNYSSFQSLEGIYNLNRDYYPEDTRYNSWHGKWGFMDLYSKYPINILVFSDDIKLNSHTIIYEGEHINIQKADDILYWKQKYNRTKDKEDLDKITTKIIEDTLLS